MTHSSSANETPGLMDADSAHWSFETRQIHAGASSDPTTGALAVPIYQTASFAFTDTQHAADLFSRKQRGNIYTRIQNPTHEALERRVASLEGGLAAVALASGQAAVTLAVLNLASAGDHIVSSASLYGGTYSAFRHTLPKMGVTATLIDDPDDMDAWRAAIRPHTKALFAEAVGNPRSNVLDIAAVARTAHEAGLPLIVDNTLPTPYLLRPFEHGADIVVHSATKFLGGHGAVLAGLVVDSGRFDFGAHPDHFPAFTEPDPSGHHIRYWPDLGPGAFAAKLRGQLLRDIGPAISPHSAFLLLQGIETLSLRMERHTANAKAVAQWLSDRPEVRAVHYAGLPSSPWYETARRYLPRGAGGIVSFDLEGGEAACGRFIDALRLHSHVANIGDVRSLVIHPASTVQGQLTASEQLASGVGPSTVRLSVGLEAVDDITADLRAGFHALEAAR